MKPEYVPRTLVQKLGKLVEECGEVQQAVGKSLRFGLAGVNPELPKEQQETNCDYLLREIEGLEEAIAIVRNALKQGPT
jgi:NTP pyrophosphatase (non-canonical NTP hydrolase)